VLPELALAREDADEVARRLARTGLSLFITGAMAQEKGPRPPWNGVMTYLLEDGAVLTQWRQAKHHRWKLEGDQIRAYGLKLDPRYRWWEHVDVANRHLVFYAFHEGATLATLVCEDLARIDPVQPALRALGPNLLIALLMDGPQLATRWPGKYATVLAEDPGTSVLTLTSVGFVDRSNANYAGSGCGIRSIALWKETARNPVEIVLDRGAHAVLISLKVSFGEPEYTMDRRTDSGMTARVTLQGRWQVGLPHPPAWLAVPRAGPALADWRTALRRGRRWRPFEYTIAGYPSRNPRFDKAAANVVQDRMADIKRLDQFFEEWSASGLRRLKQEGEP
jgi:hypothetical protein